MSPTTTYHKFYSRLLRIRFLPTLNTPRNFQSSHLHSSRNFYPANSIHTLIRPISLISINLPSSTAVVRGSISTIAGVSTMASGGGNGGDSVTFRLTPTSSLKIQKGDITQWSVDGSSDAIVNPANERMLGGGGADGAIHRAAGPELRDACYKEPEVRPGVRCPTGEARITPGFRLPASHVIHTVGPIYDANPNPKASLTNAYRNSLRLAKENNIQYIAFPAISCGVFGSNRYPYDEAATVAISTVKEFGSDLKEVHFVLFSDEIYDAWVTAAKEQLKD
ncbi:macro domain-containing protein VPA0103 isoform X2 [Capsicum annuum]|uniref:macro domain-containing protein VPA0103 isoform X2 n=1 Tax=Capsicum annuum TaxID=4072 RepID=UPI001FB0A53E|nr:macro domain-containing protein VPA0103 isoform X2 [Capsicum annuum]